MAPLHIAALRGYEDIVLFLVACGADVNLLSCTEGEVSCAFDYGYLFGQTVRFLYRFDTAWNPHEI